VREEDAGRIFTKNVKIRPASFLLFAAAIGLALRLAFALGYWTGQPLTRDEREYLSLARSLASGHGFTYDEDLLRQDPDPFSRAPGYPAFLAIAGGGQGPVADVPALVKVAQAGVGALGVVVIGLVACQMAGATAGAAAALIAALYPPLVWIAGYAYSEAIAWPLGLAAVWIFNRLAAPADRARVGGAVACGLLIGLALLVRGPEALLA